MCRVFYPVVLYHILQCVVATQSCQSPLSCECLYVATDYVVHPVFLEGAVLVPNHLEFTVNLPQQEAALEKLEGEVVEAEYSEISPDEEGVFVGL